MILCVTYYDQHFLANVNVSRGNKSGLSLECCRLFSIFSNNVIAWPLPLVLTLVPLQKFPIDYCPRFFNGSAFCKIKIALKFQAFDSAESSLKISQSYHVLMNKFESGNSHVSDSAGFVCYYSQILLHYRSCITTVIFLATGLKFHL